MADKPISKRQPQQRVNPLTVPKFKSEAEEADWWYRNRNIVEDLIAKHGRRVGRNLEVEIALKPAKLISIRLPEADIQRTKRLAARKAMPYQTYLRSLLHESLAREERKQAKSLV
jgi:predicted DNA binding CopG/RHH family protein